MYRMRTIVLLCSLIAASWAAAMPQPSGSAGAYAYPTPPSFGKCVASYTDGSFFVAGSVGGCGGSDFFVQRHDVPLTQTRWSNVYDATCMDNVPRGAATFGDIAYVAGGVTGGQYLARIGADGSRVWTVVPNMTYVCDVAVASDDGSIWVVGYDSGPPMSAVVIQYRDNGSGVTQLGRNAYRFQDSYDTQAFAVAVAADAAYIGGAVLAASIPSPWVMAVNRTGGVVRFSQRTTDTVSRSWIARLVAGQGRVFGLHLRDNGSGLPLSGRVAAIDTSNGTYSESADVFNGMGMTTFSDFPCGIAMHPTLPILITGGVGTIRVHNFGLEGLWSVGDVSAGGTGPVVGGVAISNRLDYTVAVAYTTGFAATEIAHLDGYAFTQDLTQVAGTSNLVAAPNLMDLAEAGSFIRFIVKPLKATKETKIEVFDRAGNLFWSKVVALEGAGNTEYVWDGFSVAKRRIGPGGYVAILTGSGSNSSDRAPFVVTGKSK